MEREPLKMEDFVFLSIEDLVNCIKDHSASRTITLPEISVKEKFEEFVEKETSARRDNSTISQMRKLHNFVKQTLFENITGMIKSPVNCLDIAVGRGGDMWKWNSAGIVNVFGFDRSSESIKSINPFNQGAEERYLVNRSKLKVAITYTVGDAVGPQSDIIQQIEAYKTAKKITGFELLSCQFAMHYFFRSPETLGLLFTRFSPLVKRGGYFMGTCVDGAKIKRLLGESHEYTSDILRIHKLKQKNSLYGSAYTFEILDQYDKGNYFNSMGVSTEYLVDVPELVKVAGLHGFKPVFLNFFERVIGKNEFTRLDYIKSRPLTFLNFEEIYPGYLVLMEKLTIEKLELKIKKKRLKREDFQTEFEKEMKKILLTPEQEVINGLYTTFIFIKT